MDYIEKILRETPDDGVFPDLKKLNEMVVDPETKFLSDIGNVLVSLNWTQANGTAFCKACHTHNLDIMSKMFEYATGGDDNNVSELVVAVLAFINHILGFDDESDLE